MKRQEITKYVAYPMLICMLLWIFSCAVNPVTGKREFMLLSESDEIELGQQSDGQVISAYGLYNDPKIEQFVTDVGTRMAVISHRANLKYYFRVLDTPVINAFAVPGGYVYITRGILAHLNSEAEFAGVMGHEIGHITARHSAKQYSRAQIAQIGLGVGSVVSESFARMAGLASTGLGLMFLRFGRDAERESDQLGVEYSTRLDYDAYEMANFFQTLERMSPGESGGLPGWFSTHPSPTERVGNIRGLSDQWQQDLGKKRQNMNVGRDSFLRMLDGLVYGDDPKSGYTEGNMFYHPDLKFQFAIPSGWQLINTPSQVQVVSEDQKSATLLSIASGTIADVSSKFLTETKATVVRSGNEKVNGFTSRQVLSDIASEQGTLRVISYFIDYNQNIYVFHGLAPQTAFSQYQANLESVMKSFEQLTDQSKINVKPDRIRLRTVKQRKTLRDALISFGVADNKLEELALINGMLLTDTVQANTLLKVIGK